MKHLFFVLCLFPFVTHATEREKLDKLLAAVALAQSNSYVEARTTIDNLGTNALPVLALAGSDSTLSWQQRLVARICYERMTRTNDIQFLLEHDWRSYPPYRGVLQPGKKYMGVLGPTSEMGPYVAKECRKVGLWYYYIELTWKKTGECPTLKPRPDRKFDQAWPRWCREALKDQPEGSYLLLAILERLHNDSRLDDAENVEFYKELLKSKVADAVPVLVERYDAFSMREVTGLELYTGARKESYLNLFKPMLSFADSRHVEMLEKFVGEHEAFTDLKPKLADVRARPALAPKMDPPFRLGTNLVTTP